MLSYIEKNAVKSETVAVADDAPLISHNQISFESAVEGCS